MINMGIYYVKWLYLYDVCIIKVFFIWVLCKRKKMCYENLIEIFFVFYVNKLYLIVLIYFE